MKNFLTVSLDVIRECRLWFGIPDLKVSVVKRKNKFLMKMLTPLIDYVSCLALMRCQSAIAMCNFSLSVFLVIFLLPCLW